MTIQDISFESPNHIRNLYKLKKAIASEMKKSYKLEFKDEDFSTPEWMYFNSLFVNDIRDSVIIDFHRFIFRKNELDDFLGEDYKENVEKLYKLEKELNSFWITNSKENLINERIKMIFEKIDKLINEKTNSVFKINGKYKINVKLSHSGIFSFQFSFSEPSKELNEGLRLWFSKTRFEPVV